MPNKTTYGLVLAGGESRRMGCDKASLQRDGVSQLAHSVSVVAECVDKAFVSTRAEQKDDPVRSGYDQIVDCYGGIGPVAGILSALELYPDVDWLVVACDLPNIDTDTIRYLLRERRQEFPFTAYLSTHDGLPEPLCAVYSAGCAGLVKNFVSDGVHCPRKILIRSGTQLLTQIDPRSLDNVNTPEDLDKSILQAAT